MLAYSSNTFSASWVTLFYWALTTVSTLHYFSIIKWIVILCSMPRLSLQVILGIVKSGEINVVLISTLKSIIVLKNYQMLHIGKKVHYNCYLFFSTLFLSLGWLFHGRQLKPGHIYINHDLLHSVKANNTTAFAPFSPFNITKCSPIISYNGKIFPMLILSEV